MHTSIKFSILSILWAIVFIPVYPELLDTWLHSTNNSHGLLVPFISAFIIFKKKDKLKSTTLSSRKTGAVILIASMAIYVVSIIGAVAVVSRLMIVISLIGLVLYVLGDEVFKQIRFPLLLLFFMVPIPDSIYSLIAFPLQLFATKVSTFLIQAMGIPAYREGNMVYFLQTQLEVAEACSGLRSMVAFLMLGAIFADAISKRSRLRSAILVISTVPLALGVNIIRVTGTGVLAHMYGERVARGFLHEFSGLLVFAMGFILLACEYLILDNNLRKI